ncbi:MAG: GNAT family N-acetyltransferase, partial [Bacteroidota bacterium]
MQLQTTRLILREATLKDEQFIFELLTSPTWLKYIGDRGIETLMDARIYIQDSLISSYQKKGYGLWIMQHKVDNRPIGLCGFLCRYY